MDPTSHPFWRRLQTPSGTSGEAFGLDFGGDFGVDLGPPGATGHFCKKWHRATARARFLVVRGIGQKWRPKWLPAATRLQERLGRLLGSMLARFWPLFLSLKSSWKAFEKLWKHEALLGPKPGSAGVRRGVPGGMRAARTAFSWWI